MRKFLVLILAALYLPFSYSANPSFTLSMKNDVLAGNMLEFDVYALSSGAPFELAGAGLAFQFNTSALNGGSLTASVVDNSSGLTNTSQLPSSVAYSASGLQSIVIFPAAIPPGSGSGSMISNIYPGTKLYRVRLSNSNSWAIAGSNKIDVASADQYPVSFTAYVNGTNTAIWDNATALNEFTGSMLPVELESFTSNLSGRNVQLNWLTVTEKNSEVFEVEKSFNGGSWIKSGEVRASGMSNSPKYYSFKDEKLQVGNYRFRLKMIDNDGSYKYSSIQRVTVSLPKDFSLSQNYPNPFNPSTKIDYELPADSKVTLAVYSVTGEKVAEIINREQPAGYYSAEFKAASLPSGLYILRLTADNKSAGKNVSLTKKMILLK